MSKKLTSTQNGRLPGQEELLLDLARSLRHHRKGRRAIHLHLSRLSRPQLHAHDLRLVVETLGPLVRRHEGRLFRLVSQDMVLVVKDVTFAALDEAVLRVRGIFRDSPAYRQIDNGTRSPDGSDAFCSFYDIEREAERFLATAQRLNDELPDMASAADVETDAQTPVISIIPFTAAQGKAAPLPLSNKDLLARHILTTSVMALSRDGLATPILSELHMRVDSLKVEVRTGQNLGRPMADDRWLLRVLADLLDEQTITGLIIGSPLPTAFSLPLQIDSVDSREFQDFTAAYRRLTRGSVVFEFASEDMLKEPALFLAARDRIIELGHRLCITGWDPHLFALMNVPQLEVHFHKISWTPLLINGFRNDWGDNLRENVRRTGATKVVLADCSSAEAVAFGQRHGLLLFQGPHLDTVPRG